MSTLLRGIGHVALVTRDLDRFTRFYAEALGAPALERSERDRRLGLGFVRVGDAVLLHVFERPEGGLGGVADDELPQPFRRGPVDHISLEAAGPEAFSDARRRLVALGATDGDVVDFGPLVSLFFVDPDGRQLELSLTKPPGWDPPFALTAPGPR